MEALMIGVSGMRGTIGGTLTPAVVVQMPPAFAAWLKANEKPANGKHFRVVFGRDSRPSGSWVRDAAAAGADRQRHRGHRPRRRHHPGRGDDGQARRRRCRHRHHRLAQSRSSGTA